MTKEEVFDNLARRGIARAEVSFYGGGDEGQIDGIVLYDYALEELDGIEEHSPAPVLDGEGNPVYEEDAAGRKRPKRLPLTPAQEADNALLAALEGPVDEYGGFDGGFEVDGNVTWDVEQREVILSGQETAWVPFERAL